MAKRNVVQRFDEDVKKTIAALKDVGNNETKKLVQETLDKQFTGIVSRRLWTKSFAVGAMSAAVAALEQKISYMERRQCNRMDYSRRL